MLKRDAKQIAKMYLKALIIYYDGFYCEDLSESDNDLVQQEILKIVDKICPIENIPTNIDDIVSSVLDE